MAGCEDGAGPFGGRAASGSGGTGLAQGGGPELRDSDVEAPSVFEKRETGLWDGRPSLGGIWVAHPDVGGPQRVLIQNEANGRSVVGALFRRERENPGPRIQVSSDAAESLAILAGQPTQMRIVALARREAEVTADPAAPVPAEGAPAEGAAGEASPAAGAPAGDAAATAAAAVAAVSAAPPAEGAPAHAEGLGVPDIQPVPETGSPSSFGRRNRAAPAATALAVEGEEAINPVPEDAPPTSFGRRSRRAAEPGAAEALVAPGETADISVVPLDGDTPAAPAIQRPFIQTGTFSSEAAANSAADKIRAEGLSATVVTASGSGNWRVLVGPAATAAEQSDLLGRVRALGYRDAFPVAG